MQFGLQPAPIKAFAEQSRVAPAIEVTADEQESEPTRLARSERTSVRLAQRARIVLLAAQGQRTKDIAKQRGLGRVQVARWRERSMASGLQGIERDLPRGAQPVKVDNGEPTGRRGSGAAKLLSDARRLGGARLVRASTQVLNATKSAKALRGVLFF